MSNGQDHGPERSFSNGNGPPPFERPEGEMHWWNLV